MARPNNTPTTQVNVIDAVVARLIREVSGFSKKTCFLTAEPPVEVPANIRDNLFCTVSPTNGQFDQEALVGGGANEAFEMAGVQIVVFSAIKLDRVGQNTSLLTKASRGLLVIKQNILKALTGHDLLDGNNEPILINLMAPLTSDNPRSAKDKSGELGDISLQFSTDFEWDLT